MRRSVIRGSARLRDESGVALVMALGILLVLSLGFATSIAVTSAGARHAHLSKGDQQSYALAEDGINSAVAVIFADANVAAATSVDCSNGATVSAYITAVKMPPPPPNAAAHTTTRTTGTVNWGAEFNCVPGA